MIDLYVFSVGIYCFLVYALAEVNTHDFVPPLEARNGGNNAIGTEDALAEAPLPTHTHTHTHTPHTHTRRLSEASTQSFKHVASLTCVGLNNTT